MSDNTNKGELLMQIAALRAQVEQLRSPLRNLINVEHERRGSLQVDGQFAYRVKEQIFKDAKNALDKTPAQCLAEKAQAGRDAVISALCLYGEPTMTVSEIDSLADKYADQILQAAKEQQNED